MEEQEKIYGEIKLGEKSKIVAKDFKGKTDIRIWVTTQKYTGYTKKGILFSVDRCKVFERDGKVIVELTFDKIKGD